MSDKASGLNLEANSPEKAKAIDPLHSGWLMKKGKVRRNWTKVRIPIVFFFFHSFNLRKISNFFFKRWFVLMNGILTYSKAANVKKKKDF